MTLPPPPPPPLPLLLVHLVELPNTVAASSEMLAMPGCAAFSKPLLAIMAVLCFPPSAGRGPKLPPRDHDTKCQLGVTLCYRLVRLQINVVLRLNVSSRG